MNIKTSLYYIVVLLVAAGVILATRSFAPGSRSTSPSESDLPDHITRVVATTLPQAVLQARRQGKGGVRITDPSGNTIWVSTDDVVSTTFVVRGTPVEDASLQEGIERLFASAPSLPSMRDVSVREIARREGDDDVFLLYEVEEMTFTVNETNHAKISDLMYEISIDVFKLRSTTEWVIDLTGEPF